MKSPTKNVLARLWPPKALCAQPSLVVPVERHPHVLHVDQGLPRRLAHNLDRVLVSQEVAALNRIVGVVFPLVPPVGQRRIDAALGRVGVTPHRVDLADYGGVGPAGVGRNRSPHPGQSGPYHQNVMLQHGCHFLQ